MTLKTTRPYGLWDSPLSPRSLAEGRRLESAAWDSDGRTLVWLEGRSGRGVLIAQAATGGEAPRDLTTDQSVRAEVGYGGGDFTVHGGWMYFVVHPTGRIFRQPLSPGHAEPVTPAFGQAASPVVSPDGRWLAYVHHDEEGADRIGVVDAEGRHWPRILTGGHDFYMQPRWSPDGRALAWIAWDHPNMPWDGTTLYLAPVVGMAGPLPQFGEPQALAGGPDTAIFQPEFTPDGRHLIYVSDETGWGRIVAQELQTGDRRFLTPDGVEYAAPGWSQGMRTFALLPDSRRLVAVANRHGFQKIERIDLQTGETEPIEELAEYTEVTEIVAARDGQRIAIIGSSPSVSPRLVEHDLSTGATRVCARSTGETTRPESLARCEALTWQSDGETVYGLFYPPTSDRFTGRGLPPLMMLVHGGPTSQVKAGWKADAQFFATRGYAVLYVNYRGSTGYGRPYMLSLRGQWGLHDVADCISGAKHLAETGRVDPERMVIMGGSAGGFTVLQTLARHPEAFTAGISLYGVADQFHLAAHTHKFESRYLDSMLGPLPESSDVYRDRSPIFHADGIRRPLAVFQGAIDRVVPQEQSDVIVDVLRRRGVPHVYHVYEGEGHGWRKRETIAHFYQAVEEFLRKYVLFA